MRRGGVQRAEPQPADRRAAVPRARRRAAGRVSRAAPSRGAEPQVQQSAWMTAWTEFDRVNGFRYQIVDEGGSGYIRIEGAARGARRRAEDLGRPRAAEGVVHPRELPVRRRRRGGRRPGVGRREAEAQGVLLVEGSIFVQPGDGELTRIEGKLSKTPSFWTRRVESCAGTSARAASACRSRSSRSPGPDRRPLDVQDDLPVPDDQRSDVGDGSRKVPTSLEAH